MTRPCTFNVPRPTILDGLASGPYLQVWPAYNYPGPPGGDEFTRQASSV